jgi:hypothetical protein
MKHFMALICGVCLVATSIPASAIPVGTFGDIDSWVTDASRILGTGGEYAGVDPLAGLIGDDLTDGAINLGLSSSVDSFLLTFDGGITNGAGDDFVVFDGRFSSDGVSIGVGGTELAVSSSSFVDSGLDFILKNTSFTFDLYGASLDLSDYGVAVGASITSLTLTAYAPEADIMGVGVLNSGSTAVPEPSIIALFGAGLIGIGFVRRRKLQA